MKRILIGVAVLAAAAFQFQPAHAQRSDDEAGQKKAAKTEEAAQQYPSATREEPAAKASAKLTPKLKKLYKAYNDKEVAAARPLADEIIADENANAYDKAMSARLAGAMLRASDAAAARDYLQRALEYNGLNNNDHYEVMHTLAQLQMQDKDYDEALATIERLQQETNSQKPEHLAMKGNALLRTERYPEAIVALKAAIAGVDEPRVEWTQLLMAAYTQSGQPGEAAKLAEQVESQTPGDKRSQLGVAETYLQNKQYEKAAEIYETLRAAGEFTEDRDYRNLMVSYMNSENREQEAIAVINEGLEKGVLNGDHTTYRALAEAHYFSGQPELAIEAYRKAAPLAPDGESYLNLARALLNEGRIAEAKQAAQQALDKGVKEPDDAKLILAQ